MPRDRFPYRMLIGVIAAPPLRGGLLALALLSPVIAADPPAPPAPAPADPATAAAAFLASPSVPVTSLRVVGGADLDLGQVVAGSEVPVRIRLRNHGPAPVTITGLETGCACAAPAPGAPESSAFPRVLLAESETELSVVLRTAGLAGVVRRTAVVVSDQVGHARLPVSYRVVVVPPIACDPPILDLGSAIPVGSATRASAVLTVHRQEPAAFGQVRCTNPWLRAELRSDQPGRRATVTVSLAPDAPIGPLQGLVLVEGPAVLGTAAAEPPFAPIPISVTGRVVAPAP